ncbi:17997_t:CDS:2 [Cetraspora pellucida]|uniref:17997_t:CDS:1 n=1 Tax=Cetraspora pellucida TaxID=1433469 RepID=A0A9N8WQI6_9GLOM|nr:17997_t:CDS:2 [Cetraspora pellucida]
MPHRKIYQFVEERLVREKKIKLIEYDRFRQPPSELVDSKDERMTNVKLLNNELVNLSLLRNLDGYDDKAVGSLMVEGAPLEWDKKLKLTNQIVYGLKFLHDQGVVHSELNPKNIVMHGEIPKLTNIGMSQIRNRPSCAIILEKLKIISLSDTFVADNVKGSSDTRKSMPRPYINIDCVLDYNYVLKEQRVIQLKVEFINHLALNKGRNLDGFDFIPAKKSILYDNGNLKTDKVYMSSPIIYLPKSKNSPWWELNKLSLFMTQPKKTRDSKDDDARIHVPVATVNYTCKATNEFIENVRNALNSSDSSEIKKNLERTFNDYGNYVVTKVTLGGVITIRNWSKVSAESRSYLMCYIQRGIFYGKGKVSEIFEDVPLNRIPPLETSIDMRTLGDLYTWFKGVYDCNFAEIISYEEIIPSYELLPDNLRNQIFKEMGFVPNEKPCNALIPNIPTDYDKQDILKWIIDKPPHNLYLGDWVHENALQHGVILQHSGLGHGKFAAFKFLKEPEITVINKITVLLEQPQTRQEAYLLENGIILKEEDGLELDKIPFGEYSSTLNCPLEDFKHSKDELSTAIYCRIIFNAVKISFNLSDIKVLPDFSYAVNTALRNNLPFKKLCELFGNDYGHLLSRTFTLGGILSKKYKSTGIILPQKRIILEYDIDDQTPREIEKKLKEWNKEFKHLDTSFFLNNSGDIIYRNKLGDWLKDLFENKDTRSNWNVVAHEDWAPLYKIMKKTHKNIEETFDDTYHLVCNGEVPLSKDQTTTIIKFPESLIDDKYYIYGVVIMKNANGSWDAISKVSVRFDYPNKQTYQENIVLRWCVVDTDERGFIVGESNLYSLDLFGDYLDDHNEDFDENLEIEPRFPPQMSLDDAIKQHTYPDGNTLEAWKTFVNHSRKGSIIADYWIGYYLQQDILKSRTVYEEDIEYVIQGEDTYTQVAMKYYQKAANANYPEAQLRYGFGLYYGLGVDKDKNEATRYFKLAAENNNPTAMYNLGVIWMFGDNKREKEEGEQWLIKSARLGQLKAIEICDSKDIKYRYP